MGNDLEHSRHFFRCRRVDRKNIGMGCFGLNQCQTKGAGRHLQSHIGPEIRYAGNFGNSAGPWVFASPDAVVRRHLERQLIFGHLAAQDLCRIHHRIHQGFITGAAAGVPVFLKPVPDILAGGAGIGVQQGLGRDDEARAAEPALGRAMNGPGKLDGVKLVRSADALDGRDAGLVRNPAHLGDAGTDHFPVQNHRTTSALPLATPDLCSRQFELFAQRIGQKRIRVHHHHLQFTVDIQIFSNHAGPPLYGINTNTIRPASAERH